MAFRASVVAPFVKGYAAGLTPNPCTTCNGAFRFDALVGLADRLGATAVWTGHYARLVERGGRRLVAQGLDPDKDQSYMLATVDPALLARIAFPLGGETKEEVRREAEAAGLAAAHRAESQEACFLAGDDYRAFLRREGVAPRPGAIVTEDGTEVGTHEGVWNFTPGQRRGLGVSAPEPLYALRTEVAAATVVVGPRRSLAVTTVEADGLLYSGIERGQAKLRYRSPAVPAAVEQTASGFVLRLERPVEGVARGQVAVVYDDGVVVGAGTIREAR